ncbi:oligosaccharyl transferase alpha subunit [Auriscalpium vulgare]|uniref:Oligosaccharyl transferase alpha subunit n=1 Tax=Auriscalpium vulgare TaxID=40419 RepID=A0ACB8SCL7_9AGAM|nr:oligosaccharyl transferase alpha subunit [Auriscalpium vulgare]
MAIRWLRSPLLLLGILLPSLVSAAHSFENTAIVRTVELGGALVHVTTTYAIRALESGSQKYTVTLGEKEGQLTSFLEAKLKGKSDPLNVEGHPLDPTEGTYEYTVELPSALSVNGTVNLVLDTVQTHATRPWPASAGQNDGQAMLYESDLFVLSPYKTVTQRIKVRSPSPRIISHNTPEGVSFSTESVATLSGATVTYGPFSNIPESANAEFIAQHQKPVKVRYNYEHPVPEVKSLERTAEISHWGANLNIHNDVVLHNAGPTLKGQFSRIDHQTQVFHQRLAPHILPAIVLHLPPGAHSTYYLDLNGNVSTSRFRPAPSVPKAAQSNKYSVLELRPRYPLMGGWNYTFTFGWDSPLADSAGYDAKTGKYIVGVPLHTHIASSVVDKAKIKIILPEGATDVEVVTPFPPISQERSTVVTYLDTTGRPAFTFHYENLTDKHTGLIYVTYKVPLSAHLQKPKSVAVALLGLFAFALAARRVDFRLNKP